MMRLRKIQMMSGLLLFSVMTGCITEYEHPGVESISGLLVVEGTITNDTTFIQLSRSVELTESITSAPVLDHAEVTVETEGGRVFLAEAPPEQGRYYILTGDLDPNDRYRVKIGLDGMVYVSEFLKPLITPEIESLNLHKRAQGQPVQLRINTQNAEDASPFYLWSYDEIWEYTAAYRANAIQNPYTNGEWELYGWREITMYEPYSPYYYCWSFDRSRTFLLGSSVKLSTNRIENFSLAKFDAGSLRFTMLYYVKVKQNSVRKEAYNYFQNLKENAESTGSIFGPMPSEMKGNISCLTDPGIPVIGYVEVSTTVWKEQFFDSFAGLSEYSPPRCIWVTSSSDAEDYGLNWDAMTLFYYQEDSEGFSEERYVYPRCIDCTLSGGSHDRKPSFWPNDHF